MINSRPRHPQSHGMVEQANRVLKGKIAAWRSDHQSASWIGSLPEVISAMNSQRSSVTGKSAYEIVFGQPPHVNWVSYLTRDREQVAEEDDLPPDSPTTTTAIPEELDALHSSDNSENEIPITILPSQAAVATAIESSGMGTDLEELSSSHIVCIVRYYSHTMISF